MTAIALLISESIFVGVGVPHFREGQVKNRANWKNAVIPRF